MTNRTATDLDTFTDAERALAQAIPSVYVTQLAVARCLLRLERLEQEKAELSREQYQRLLRLIDDPSAPSKVAASLPAAADPSLIQNNGRINEQQRPAPQRFTAPESLPAQPSGNPPLGYTSAHRMRDLEREVERLADALCNEQRAHSRALAEHNELRSGRDALEAQVDEAWPAHVDKMRALETDRDKLRSRLTQARKSLREQARGLKRLSLMAQLQAKRQVDLNKLSTDNARLQGELARMREQAARLDEVSDKAHEELYAVKLERDDANARAERMAAVVASSKVALAKCENYFEEYGAIHDTYTDEEGHEAECPEDDTCACELVIGLNVGLSGLTEALSALDAATSPVVEPGALEGPK